MILTGPKIREELVRGTIAIVPFSEEQVNPNSYNYRLGPLLKVYRGFEDGQSRFEELVLPEKGYVLEPGQMYLGHTLEIIGSSQYAMSLTGRSSMGRYGLFLQVSANLGHTTSEHQWTLEIVAIQRMRIYPGMIIGQVSFWRNFGDLANYTGRYGRINRPQESFVPAFD